MRTYFVWIGELKMAVQSSSAGVAINRAFDYYIYAWDKMKVNPARLETRERRHGETEVLRKLKELNIRVIRATRTQIDEINIEDMMLNERDSYENRYVRLLK